MIMKKLIIEDIENMKYLFGYKRGVVISEQDTDNEVNPNLTVTQRTAPQSQTTQSPDTLRMGVFNPKVQELQRLLNSKFNLSLVDDGKYGPKTADAIYKNIQSILKPKVKAVTDTVSAPQKQDTQKLLQQIPNQTMVK